MYRIACKFEPSHPRMAGKDGVTQLFTRGAWRVVATGQAMPPITNAGISTWWGLMFIPCACETPPRLGTLINPRKCVAHFLSARRATANQIRVAA